MKMSIKKRLTGNFMLIILITVLILEAVLLNAVKQYHYNSVESILSNRIIFSANFYSRYFRNSSLEDLVIDDVDVFWQQTKAQVQIIDLDKNVLMDSIGVRYEKNKIDLPDVKKALEGKKASWTGNVSYSSEPVMSVAYPLRIDGEVIGVLRFVTSLEQTDEIISNISKILILLGVVVVAISGLLSIFLANTISKPLEEIIGVAEKMADGQLKVRSTKRFDDEIGKLSDTLNYMAEELLKKEQLKNDFVSSISHELRTPLTSIKGWAITLKSSDIVAKDPLMKDGLDIIEEESDRLSKMVEELLDFSKFASGRITLNKEEVFLQEILLQVYKQLKPRAREKNINFVLDIDSEIETLIIDENRIKQVLINLLDNALKFTQEGGEVILRSIKEDEETLIQVIDNGPGISSDDLPYIKERFYKGKDSHSNTGLGLSICDEIVSLHNGRMKIDSSIGEGTIVNIYLKDCKEGGNE